MEVSSKMHNINTHQNIRYLQSYPVESVLVKEVNSPITVDNTYIIYYAVYTSCVKLLANYLPTVIISRHAGSFTSKESVTTI